MNEGAWDPRARLADMDSMGDRSGVPLSDLVRRGVSSRHRSGHGARAGARLQRLDRGFLRGRIRTGCSRRRCCRCRTWISHSRNCAASPAIRSFRGVFIRPMFFGDTYLTSPYFDPLWAELETAWPGRGGASDAGAVEPGVDLARAVHRKDQEPFWSDTVAGRRRRVRSPAAARDWPARRSSPPSRSSAIRWRRSCPAGWTITCSSPRC